VKLLDFGVAMPLPAPHAFAVEPPLRRLRASVAAVRWDAGLRVAEQISGGPSIARPTSMPWGAMLTIACGRLPYEG